MSEFQADGNEFSRLVPLERVKRHEVREHIAADDAERKALAARFGLIGLESLVADVRLRRHGKGPLVEVSGRWSAEVVQACVVSLEPVRSKLEESFTSLYSSELETSEEIFVDIEAEDQPEPIGPEGIDIGEAVAQQLALALDPYPRLAGVQLPDGRDESEPTAGPFAALKVLKRKV